MPLAAIHRNVIIQQNTCLYKDMSVAIIKEPVSFFLLVSIIPAMLICINESITNATISKQLTAKSKTIKSFYCSTKRVHENHSHFSQNSRSSHQNSKLVLSKLYSAILLLCWPVTHSSVSLCNANWNQQNTQTSEPIFKSESLFGCKNLQYQQ
jgi:hypothetical protein